MFTFIDSSRYRVRNKVTVGVRGTASAKVRFRVRHWITFGVLGVC